ncbi:MAG: DNA polymerase III subunit gamma/tau [Planctomycetes bacterium]|nr:DNA polymerase III subunit gamma/tau [Planctomycetota bacterium]
MSAYLVLARKYRPKTFAEVIGQEVVTEVLRGALSGGHLGHAYLFSGPRGTGKTTLARIFAKCLNCERGPTATPCGSCERCVTADSGGEVDTLELDAASHTGVDDIRELRDEVAYAPMRARYKVYIIDEVHMLTKNAFNALLKTLEEPPPHVVFLFATTDPHKVLDTVLSRCQILRLSALPEERIVARLEDVFRAEGVQAEAGVTAELARRARGGMRDALSQADKLLAFAGNQPALADLARLGGETGSQEIEAVLSLVEAGERAPLLAKLEAFVGDEEELLNGLLDAVRAAALLAWCGAETPLVQLSGSERALAAERGRHLGAERLELMLQELLRARERLRWLSGQERTVVELCLLDLSRAESTLPLSELVQRLESLERRLAGAGEAPRAAVAPPPAAAPFPPPATRASAPPSAGPSAVASPAPVASSATSSAPARAAALGAAGGWEGFLADLGKTHGALSTLFCKHGPTLLEEAEGRLRVRAAGLTSEEQRLLSDKRNQRACEQAWGRAFGRTLTLEFSGAAVRPADERMVQVQDPLTQRVQQHFEGTVEELP